MNISSTYNPGFIPPSVLTATFTQATDQAGEEVFPSLSPSGRLVCYASRPSGRWDVFLKKIEGGNAVNLTAASNANNTQPAFSPSGDQIAFRSDRDGGGIFLMDISGGSVRRLTDFGYNPAWSWDGKEIACGGEGMMLATFKNTDRSQVFAVNVASGEKRAMTSERQYAVQPSWSPQGRRIAFWEARDEGSDIWTVSTRGGPAVRLTTDGAWNWNPVWSPDGGTCISPASAAAA